MELSRGICILCTASTKVVLAPPTEYINLLPELLKNHIDIQKFPETSSTLRVCPLCLHDILQVSEHEKQLGELSENIDSCSLCQAEQDLVLVTEWAHFNKLIESVGIPRRKKWRVCLPCIKHLDLFNRIKVNFFKKYPHLELTEASEDKIKYNKMKNNNNTQLSTPGDHQSSFSHHSDIEFEEEFLTSRTKSTSNLSVALKHLKPLSCSNFKVEDYKGDFKLLEQVAFVKLDDYLVKTSHSRHGFKKNVKHNSHILSESVTPTESSPKSSFFKIRLKLNSNKSSKSYKVMPGKVNKQKSRLSLSRNKRELIVKVLKMDLDETKQRNSLEHTSSGKKRKSVTFAEDLNVEIIDGVSSRKNNTEGTPLKSLLKKSNSPTSEVFKNGLQDHSSEDDSELVSNFVYNVNLFKEWEDKANDSESYLKEIRKPEHTFDSSIYTWDSKKNDESKVEENDQVNLTSNKMDNKKRQSSDNDSAIQNDDEHEDEGLIDQENDNGTLESKKANKRKRAEPSSREPGGLETEESTTKTPENINNDKNSIEDQTNKSKRRKSNDETVAVDEAQNYEPTESDESPLKDSLGEPNDNATKPQKLTSNLDSAISISSDSSKEDRLVTLDEYKKIRRYIDEIDGSDDSGRNESITSSSEDILASQEPLNAEESENKYISEENEGAILATIDDEEPETNKDKVSDADSNQSYTGPQKVHEQAPEAPADDVITKGPIVDNDNTVSDAKNSGLAEEDAEQRQFVESPEKIQVTADDSSSVACVMTDDVGEVFSSTDRDNELIHRNSDDVTTDEPDSDRSDTLVSASCSSDSYVTATDGDKMLDSPVK